MSSDISLNYQLDIEVLTPLHVGSGRKLQRGYDFVHQRGITYRLNDQAILDERWPDDERQQRLLLAGTLADLVQDVDLSKRREYSLYRYAGDAAMNEINEHIKTVHGQAYLPGSSLKGALRTALMRTLIEGVKHHVFTRSDIGPAMRDERDSKAAKSAANTIEWRFAVGAGAREQREQRHESNYSLFRALAVADTQPAPDGSLSLQRVQVVPGLEIDVEAIKTGTRLAGAVRVDLHLLKTLANDMGFDPDAAGVVRRFVAAAHFTAQARVAQELRYHADRGDAAALGFYKRLSDDLAGQEYGKTVFVIQVGFLTGWRAKSVLGGLPN
ncbi:MAG: type III-A CRISPR-associated RAMP protein Csm5, partial [Aggregatilineales bacterium]